jgi:hypothetical protein
MSAGYLFMYGTIALTILFLLSSIDLSGMRAFQNIRYCMHDESYVSLFFKAVLFINIYFPILITYLLKPDLELTKVKYVLISIVLYLVGLLFMYVGVPVQNVDGAAVFFSNMFCNSVPGAMFVILMTGSGAFLCLLFSYYTWKSVYLFKIKGK